MPNHLAVVYNLCVRVKEGELYYKNMHLIKYSQRLG